MAMPSLRYSVVNVVPLSTRSQVRRLKENWPIAGVKCLLSWKQLAIEVFKTQSRNPELFSTVLHNTITIFWPTTFRDTGPKGPIKAGIFIPRQRMVIGHSQQSTLQVLKFCLFSGSVWLFNVGPDMDRSNAQIISAIVPRSGPNRKSPVYLVRKRLYSPVCKIPRFEPCRIF